jgi:hypothetical protein
VAKAGVASKEKTDAVFGSYASGPAFDATTNLRDRWATEEKKIKDLETRAPVAASPARRLMTSWAASRGGVCRRSSIPTVRWRRSMASTVRS